MSAANLNLLNAGLAFVGVGFAGIGLWWGRRTWRRNGQTIELVCGLVAVKDADGETQSVFQIVVQNKGRDTASIKSYGFVVDGKSHAYHDPFFTAPISVGPGKEHRLFIPVARCLEGQPFVELGSGQKIRGHALALLQSFHFPLGRPQGVQPIKTRDPALVQMVEKGSELQKVGKNREAIRLFEGAIAIADDAIETAQILNLAADSHFRLGEYAQAQTKGLAALEKAHDCGAKQEAGLTHCLLGETALKLGEWGAAAAHFDEGSESFSQAGNEEAARRALARLSAILGQRTDAESADFYRHLAAELRATGSRLDAPDPVPPPVQ
ncbi:MAG: tetratricopeptide repeat protein [Proteobacteria bacterium]|nr:tetratricopeptide repeat protein [Pseudomonadota bacterium]